MIHWSRRALTSRWRSSVTQTCALQLLTWRPDFVLADADLGSGDPARLVEVIRTTVRTPVDIVAVCHSNQSLPNRMRRCYRDTLLISTRLLAVLQMTALARTK